MKTAKRHGSKITSLLSRKKSFKNTFSSHPQLIVARLMSVSAAVIPDIVTPPYHFAKMTIAVSQGKFEKKRAETEILNETKESLFLSLEAILAIVVKLGLETHEAVEHELFNGGGYVYLALARPLKACRSRFAPSGAAYLAARKRLSKEYCSGFARLRFGQIHNLKKNLIFVDLFPTATLPDTVKVFGRWVCRGLPALQEPFVDTNEDFLSVHAMQQLCHIRDEMPGLMNTGIMKHRQG